MRNMSLIFTLIIMTILVFKKWNIIFVTIISAFIIAITNKMNIENVILQTYAGSFKNFVGSWFLIFIVSAIFGEIMKESGSSETIANILLKNLGEKRVVILILLTTFILSYSGISVFVIAFTVYPICHNLFSKLKIPFEIAPGLVLAIPATVTMVIFPGTVSIQNIIPTKYFKTTIYAAPIIGLIVSIFIFLCDYIFYSLVINKYLKNINSKNLNIQNKLLKKESFYSFIPIFIVLIMNSIILKRYFKFSNNFSISIGIILGILATFILYRKNLNIKDVINNGIINGSNALFITASIIGLGGVISKSNGFNQCISWLFRIKLNPILSMFIIVNIICMITASSTVGLTIYLEVFSKYLLSTGIDVSVLHRLTAIASAGLDAMPFASGITMINSVFKTDLKKSYKYIFVSQCIIPIMGFGIAYICYICGLK